MGSPDTRDLRRMIAGVVVVGTVFLTPSLANAACRIFNDTHLDFTVTSGNTSNQRVTPHTHTSIADGKIVGMSKEGKTISGSCRNGDSLVITLEKDIPVLTQK